MSEETNGRNLSIPRGYQPEDSKARKKWVHEFSGIELDDTLTDKEEDLQGIIEIKESAHRTYALMRAVGWEVSNRLLQRHTRAVTLRCNL